MCTIFFLQNDQEVLNIEGSETLKKLGKNINDHFWRDIEGGGSVHDWDRVHMAPPT